MIVKVTDIVWDTDGEPVELPPELQLSLDDDDCVADILSDMFGWCVESLVVERVQ